MNVREAHRTRHLVIRLDQGDELPGALVRALESAGARAGFLTGVGALEAASLTLPDRGTRRVDTPCEVLNLSGDIGQHDGAIAVRLSAVLARETDLGLSTFGGQIAWARARSLDLLVVVLDDLSLARGADAAAGPPIAPAAAPAVAPAAPPAPAPGEGPALPQKPQKPQDDVEAYPEVGDKVIHFAFGEGTVIGSDGDRIQIRQDRDGRVRAVGINVLRIEPPTTGPDGVRTFRLHRKS
jgi:predicted DNA-binding protein with PD1-like motif